MNTIKRHRRLDPVPRHGGGFTLIEVLVALSIVAILAALALPSFQQQIRQARRADGQTALMKLAIAQEKFRANCSSYAVGIDGTRRCDPVSASTNRLGLSALSQDGHYALRLSEVDASGFLAHAEPLGDQTRDQARGVPCHPLTIDQDGQREPRECW
ncbi:type IV pilin protein [Thiocystis violacea]|uniref:type IV pilin protein n=1 Tax=Thiocystis violacea TaxID=13725 RepID=UPI001908B919|nr:type IV pilin protein [Thiocystis violacea]MBK1717497.1 pilus assembly protein [Thiocystis violacea]